MIQLEKVSNPDIISERGLVVGTVDDLRREHDDLLKRVHHIRELLNRSVGGYEPILTGKKLRALQREGAIQ